MNHTSLNVAVLISLAFGITGTIFWAAGSTMTSYAFFAMSLSTAIAHTVMLLRSAFGKSDPSTNCRIDWE